MWRWALIIIVILAIAMRVLPWQAAWLGNLAILELQRPWLARSTKTFDSACSATTTLPAARSNLERSLTLIPTNSRRLTYLGRVAWLEGRCDEAIRLWQHAEQDQNEAAAFELFWRGQYEALPQAIRLRLADFAYQRGIEASKALETTAAWEWYQRAFDLVPQRRSAEKLVSVLEHTGNFSQTISLWRNMAEAIPATTADHWWAIAELHQINQEWKAAALAYTQGAELTNEPFEFWLEAGRAWERIEEFERARTAYERARQALPEAPQSYIALGNIYRGQQNYEEAAKWFEKAKQIEPKDFNSYYFLGITYFQMQHYAEARQNLNAALNLNPDHDGSLYYLALIAYTERDIQSAETLLVRAIDSIRRVAEPPGDWLIQLGDWRLEQQNCAGAREAYLEARQIAAVQTAAQEKLNQLTDHCQP